MKLKYNIETKSYGVSKSKANFYFVGWCYSQDSSNVKFEVLIDGCNIPFNVDYLPRKDVYNSTHGKCNNINCGFQLYFDYNDINWEKIEIFAYSVDEKIRICSYNPKNINNKSFSETLVFKAISIFAPRNLVRATKYLMKNGPKAFVKRMIDHSFVLGVSYNKWYNENKVKKDEIINQKNTKFDYSPTISIIVPTYNTPINFLKEMIDSVLNQTYSNWELCIADGGSNDPKIIECIKEYAQKDNRIKFKAIGKNLGISDNSNVACSLATGEYIGLFDHDDMITPDCLFEVVKALNEEKYDIIYTDEDKITEDSDNHMHPAFKPDWNPDLFYSHNYITHFFVVKKSIFDKTGGFDKEYDGAQDYDIMFKCIENSKTIYHIPRILYHWRMHSLSTAMNPASKVYCYEAGRKAIQAHYKRVGIDAKVNCMKEWGMYHSVYKIKNDPLVSIIIPNKDHVSDLDNCIKSLYNTNKYTNFEIIIVENNSEFDDTFEYYKTIKSQYNNIRVVNWKKEFNYSLINNYGVRYAKGDLLLFLNNDVEIINPDSLIEMVSLMMRDEVGVVGAKLLYANNTVQHAGVVIGFGDYGGFAGHLFNGLESFDPGYMVRNIISCDYSAVTAACMLVKKDIFKKVGGFTEEFKVSLNDIDLCLKIRELNKLVVYNAHSLWYHYESTSRGYENTPEKIKRFKGEIKLFQDTWKKYFENGDPYYNKNFALDMGPFKLKLKDS